MSKYLMTLTLGGLLLAATACSKNDEDVPHQADIVHKELNNTFVNHNAPFTVDLDDDGQGDIHISTQWVVNGVDDVLEFLASGVGANRVMANVNDRNAARKEEGLWIKQTNEGAYQWSSVQPALLMSRVFPGADPLQDRLEGVWIQQTNKYMPVQLVKQGAVYNGWIKLSFQGNTPKGMIVHSAAYNKIAGEPIKAGQQ